MSNDFTCQESDDIENLLYSQIHHSFQTYHDAALVVDTKMPRKKVPYRPVRYFPKKGMNSPFPRDLDNAKTGINNEYHDDSSITSHNSHKSSNYFHKTTPINVTPQNRNTIFTVIKKKRKDYHKKKFSKKFDHQNREDFQNPESVEDVKPKLTATVQMKTSSVNKHTIILSDSDDEVTEKVINKFSEQENEKHNNSNDDDVILIETPCLDVIEIVDGNGDKSQNSENNSSINKSKNKKNYASNERSELLSTPESSSSNDFLESSHSISKPDFNFGLHGSEFKDSEFLRPTVPVDMSESGSISSVSDISSSLKAHVFDIVDFPKEKENLFEENDLEKFRDSITPQRSSRKIVSSDSFERFGVESHHSQKKLPTLSDIQGEISDSSQKRSRVKKRKLRLDIDEGTLEESELPDTIQDSSRKKKKNKNRRNVDDNDMNKHSHLETEESLSTEIQENNESHTLVVRSDLFNEEHLTHSKKNKKKRKDSNDNENLVSVNETNNLNITCEKPYANSSCETDLQNDYDSINRTHAKTKGKRKRTCENEMIGEFNERNNDNLQAESKKKRKKNNKTSSDNTDSDSINKKQSNIELSKYGVSQPTEAVEQKSLKEYDTASNIDEIQEKGDDTLVSTRDSNLKISYEPPKSTSIINNQLNFSEDSARDQQQPENNPSTSEKCSNENGLNDLVNSPCLSSVQKSDVAAKDGVEINIPERNKSVWNMCQNNFFSSQESLFSVSNTERVTGLLETNNISEEGIQNNLSKITVDSLTSTPQIPLTDDISQVLESLPKQEVKQETDFSGEVPTETSEETQTDVDVTKVLKAPEPVGVACKIQCVQQILDEPACGSEFVKVENQNVGDKSLYPSQSDAVEEHSELSESNILDNSHAKNICVKLEREDKNVEEVENLKSNYTEIKDHSNQETTSSNNIRKKQTLSDFIQTIVNEENNSGGIQKLCDFLEELKDPNDVLRNVSMIKQAFLDMQNVPEKEILNECNANEARDVDTYSISSDDSSIMCLSKECVTIEIEDDITLANCGVEIVQKNVEANKIINELKKQENVENRIVDDSGIIPTVAVNSLGVFGDHESIRGIVESQTEGEHVEGLDKYDVEVIQTHMPSDPRLWKICSDDIFPKPTPRGKRCIKCREIGHLGNRCPNKYNLPKCSLCGIEGHLDFKCPNKICMQCGEKTVIMQKSCNHCKHYKTSTCSMCRLRGHPKEKCPDLWRRYHLTIEHGPLVQAPFKLKDRDKLWCCYCAKQGHLEYYCYYARKKINFQPIDPTVHHYVDVYRTKTTKSSDRKSKKEVIPSLLKIHVNNAEMRENDIGEIQKAQTRMSDHLSDSKNSSQKTEASILSVPLQNKDKTFEEPNISLISNSENYRENIDIPQGFFVIDEIGNNSLLEKNDESQKNDIEENETKILEETIGCSSTYNSEKSSSVHVKNSLCGLLMNHKSDFESPVKPAEPQNESKSESTVNVGTMRFFMESSLVQVKDFVRQELLLLRNTKFKIKAFYYRFVAYERDSKELEPKINIEKKKNFYKQLNMLIFGRRRVEKGGSFLKKLETFVNSIETTSDKAMRYNLHLSHDYIFGTEKHPKFNYMSLLQSLKARHGNKEI